jgi:hypothetical protein
MDTNAKIGHRWENGTRERQNVSFFFGRIIIDFKMFNSPFFWKKRKWKSDTGVLYIEGG